MRDIFGKPFEEINFEDIERLINDGASEDYYLEYKETLPAKNNKVDKWIESQSGIGKIAKKKVAKEIIAFANVDGGILIIGIEETDSDPSRAKEVKPLPAPHDLAKRLRDQMGDTIEPKIPNLKIKGLETDKEVGIVIAKVEKSISAPHRSKPTSECFIRRNDRSEKMTMKEIKNLTLDRYHEFDRIDKLFNERSDLFKRRLEQGKISFDQRIEGEILAVRISYLPITSRINFDKIDNTLDPISKTLKVDLNNQEQELQLPFFLGKIRPILRGRKYYRENLHIEVHENGLLEYYLLLKPDGSQRPRLDSDWLLAMNYKGLHFIDELLSLHNISDIKYGYEIEILTNKENFNVYLPSFDRSGKKLVQDNHVKFPRYFYDRKNNKQTLVNMAYKDFANYCGYSNIQKFKIV